MAGSVLCVSGVVTYHLENTQATGAVNATGSHVPPQPRQSRVIGREARPLPVPRVGTGIPEVSFVSPRTICS